MDAVARPIERRGTPPSSSYVQIATCQDVVERVFSSADARKQAEVRIENIAVCSPDGFV